MKIGVISDSHGRLDMLPLAMERMGRVEAWIHLGDHYRDAMRLEEQTGIAVHAVLGNCDFGPQGLSEEVWEPAPHVRLLLCHGHCYGVKSGLQRLYYRAMELDCQAALFGHTHVPLMDKQGNVLLLNPGTLSLPRAGQSASCACLELLADGTINAQIYRLR